MLNQLALINIVSGVFALGPVLALIIARKRLGTLNAASWLVVWGSVIVAGEHGQFAISYSVPFISGEGTMVLLPHARIHFFMAGIYTLLGVLMLGVIARTLLREGRPVGWYAILLTLLIGGSFDLLVGGLWFQHGSPPYQFFGVTPDLGL